MNAEHTPGPPQAGHWWHIYELRSALIRLTDEMNNYFGFDRDGFSVASGDVNLNILKRRYEEALKVIEATKEGQ